MLLHTSFAFQHSFMKITYGTSLSWVLRCTNFIHDICMLSLIKYLKRIKWFQGNYYRNCNTYSVCTIAPNLLLLLY